ncbi:MAG: phosphatidylserine decarboxylase [Akkermansia sp.]|nr:phosphatidylserine decarboxylase [Akkermansia sp.]
MEEDGITFYNRYTGEMEREKVMGERALRWIYGTATGKLALHLLVKRAAVSKVMGWLKDRPSSARCLPQFVQEYGIDMTEAERAVEEYATFNDFFTRTLKPGARPVCGDGLVALPADGRHSGWQDAAEMRGTFVKGQSFDLPALLGSAELARKYAHGTVVLSRLCPVDYHRFHFAVSGTPEAAVRIPGPLASVSPYCLRRRISWLWTNKRELTVIHSDAVGNVLSLAVGATGVGAITQTYTPGQHVDKAQEQGYFAFGGSTVMTFFEPGRIRLAEDIAEHSAACVETYAHMGDVLGSVL